MRKEDKLKKVIARAFWNGWENVEGITTIEITGTVFLLKSYAPNHILFDVKEILLDHDFAKAFFPNGVGITQYCEDQLGLARLLYGEWKGVCKSCGKKFNGKRQIQSIRFGHKNCPVGEEVWQDRLKEAVLEEDIIDYYYKYL